MPIFQPRNRVQILREMVARTVARSELVGLTRNSAVFHLLASAANEDAEQYLQMAKLRQSFSLDTATGSDLDERAKDIQPAILIRRPALFSSGSVEFSRPGTSGTIAIPAGTQVGATDAQGQIRYRTTIAGTILNGNSTSGAIAIVATVAGARGNVESNQIVQLLTTIPGLTGVTNIAALNNGSDRESDESFRARLRGFVQAISRGTPNAIESYARNVILADGRRVLFAKLVEPVRPTGLVVLYVDDGTGAIEEFSDDFITSLDTFLTAAGGEIDVYVTEAPIRDDGSFALFINAVLQVRDVDYALNPSTGQIELFAPLIAGDVLTANYRFYAGLIRETQKVLDGDPTSILRRPGVRAAGVNVQVKAPATVFQTIDAQITAESAFDPTTVSDQVIAAIQDYVNGLNIGEYVIVAEIVERAMGVDGMFNFSITTLNGGAPIDQVILGHQVARITSAGINLN